MTELDFAKPPVLSPQEWEAARQQLLVKEKALTRARDALAAERRRMPWVAVGKDYEFEGPNGRLGLLDLFEGRRQLIVYRAFYEPGVFGWPEQACRGCSMVADQVAHLAHLNARDTTLVFVSRAPQADIARLKERMGWQQIPWLTVTDDFDADFDVDEWHGTNAFIRDGEKIFRTYFINNRGDEQMGGTWNYLDITALGRQEEWEDSPEGYPQTPTLQMVELARQLCRGCRAGQEVGRGVRCGRGRLSGSCQLGAVGARMMANHVGRKAAGRTLVAVDWLALGAAPTFAVMATITALSGDAHSSMLCAQGGSQTLVGGMAPMYLLMAAFHLVPWFKLTRHS